MFRKWDGEKPAPANLPFSVLQELAPHPDRFAIVANNPNLTLREARELNRTQKGGEDVAADWNRLLMLHITKTLGLPLDLPADFDPEPSLEPGLRGAGEHLLKMADRTAQRVRERDAAPPAKSTTRRRRAKE